MKKLLVILTCLFFTTNLVAQNDTIVPPYKKFPNFPPVKLLLPDSVTYFTKADLKKKTASMVMLFNPQCSHCQHETEELVKNIDKFKNIEIIMATSMAFDSMKVFREKYGLEKYKNIIVTYDPNFFLISFYSISSLPTLAFYNKKQELISVFEGGLPIEGILKEFDKD